MNSNEVTMIEQFGDGVCSDRRLALYWDTGPEKSTKEQQPSNKQQMAARTSKNSKRVFIDEAFKQDACIAVTIRAF